MLEPAKYKLTPAQLAAWERKRRGGRMRYIVLNGVLLFGIPMAVIWPIVMWLLLPNLMGLPLLLLVSLIIFPIAGYFYGAMTWKIMETNYERRKTGTVD